MKISAVTTIVAFATLAFAKTDYVTRYHYVTVDAAGKTVGTDIVISNAAQETTLQTVKASSASFVEADDETSTNAITASPSVEATSQTTSATKTSSTSATTTSSSTESDSGIYSEISSSGADYSFAKSILDAHNEKRALHSASDLSWSTDLYTYAQDYADKYTCGSSLVHSGGKYGENLASGYSTGVAALDAWYSEGDDYNYSSNTLDHFTQVIWKSTTQLGCAYKSCGSSGLYVICSYNPAGNIVNDISSNISAN